MALSQQPSPLTSRTTRNRTCNGLTRCRLVLAAQVFPPHPQKKKKEICCVCVCVRKTNAKTCCPLEIITDKRDQQRGGSARRRPEEALYKPSFFFSFFGINYHTQQQRTQQIDGHLSIYRSISFENRKSLPDSSDPSAYVAFPKLDHTSLTQTNEMRNLR